MEYPEYTVQLFDLMLVILTGQGMYVVILLLASRQGRSLSNRLLALIILGYSLQLLDLFLIRTNLVYRVPWMAFFGTPFNLAFGPMLLGFIYSGVYKNFQIRPKHLMHLLPFAAWFVYLLFMYHLKPGADKLDLLSASADRIALIELSILTFWLVILHMFAYLGISFFTLHAYLVNVRQKLSSIRSGKLNWLYGVLISFLFLWLLTVVRSYGLGTMSPGVNLLDYLILFLIFGFLFSIGYLGWNRTDVFTSGLLEKGKYTYSSISMEQAGEWLARVKEAMRDDRLYLDPDLQLKKLAGKVEIPAKYISQVINEYEHMNFYEFVNQYRIEHATQLLEQGAAGHLSVDGVGYQSGFSSKSSFYTAFKRHTGTTPSKYMQK